ncbi:MAG: hypothetical protein ACLSIL_19960 [Enterococcus casseliflavus]
MKNVNSERGHFIAPFTSINTAPTESAWVELALTELKTFRTRRTEATEEKVLLQRRDNELGQPCIRCVQRHLVDYDSEDPAQTNCRGYEIQDGCWTESLASSGQC